MSRDEISIYEVLLSLETTDEVESFLKDLLTPSELTATKERWLVAQLLYQKDLSYRKINKLTGVSTTTISRVARFLNQETNGGYAQALKKDNRRKGKN